MSEREGLLDELSKTADTYFRAAKVEEIVFWIGSAAAAICSAVAGLSVAADLSNWNSPYGKVFTATLAAVPVIWTAAERSLHLRRLSLFNYAVVAEVTALSLEIRYAPDFDPKAAALRYAAILRQENTKFTELLSSDDFRVKQQDDPVPRS